MSKTYFELVKRFPLRPIKNGKMAHAASQIFSELTLRAGKRTRDEEDYLIVLEKLIGDYEDKHFRPIAPPMTPQRALESFMEDKGLTVTVLARAISVPHSVISEFLAGKRGLSKTNAVKIGGYFCVSAELFLPRIETKMGVAY
jgi:HTH-type transcriptional regulator/antitoxin HigA